MLVKCFKNLLFRKVMENSKTFDVNHYFQNRKATIEYELELLKSKK